MYPHHILIKNKDQYLFCFAESMLLYCTGQYVIKRNCRPSPTARISSFGTKKSEWELLIFFKHAYFKHFFFCSFFKTVHV